MSFKSINVFGVTGSIGKSAQDVILNNSDNFNVVGVSAHSNVDALAQAAIALNAKRAVIADEAHLEALREALSATDIHASGGRDALNTLASQNVDMTLAAIVGMAGLEPLMHSIEHSHCVAIANKEPLVAAGELVMAQAHKHNTKILPVDSEHNAIYQVFDFENAKDIERIILTASGGPFRDWTLEDMCVATPSQALAHPNWTMGSKISIDSATMMNKALEVIEAYYLFDIAPAHIDILIHPQSIIHSMVEYCDGSVLAQMGESDMRTPLSNVLNWPERLNTPGKRLDFTTLSHLFFEKPDTFKFPSISMAYECLVRGQYACVAFNAANEVAVDAFLNERIGFLDIAKIIRAILDAVKMEKLRTVEEILKLDNAVRIRTQSYISNNSEFNLTEMVS